MMEDRSGLNFILGVFVGAFVGASVAILLAPQSGVETRGQIREAAEKGREKLEKYSKDFREDASELFERGHRYMDEKYREVKAALSKKVKNNPPALDSDEVVIADLED